MIDETQMSHFSTGRCECEELHYKLRAAPLFTHACHCLDCQRRTGSAFSMTTFVLRADVIITHGQTLAKRASPRSTVYSCSKCRTVIYIASTAFPLTVILKQGTLHDPSVATPQAHIWVRRKQPWLTLPEDVPQFEEQYDRETTWPTASLARIKAAEGAPD